MAYILVENLTKNFGEKTLFEEITFSVNQGEKIALVAENGTGKSTLLRIIAGVDEADGGRISKQNGVRVAYLSQEPDLNPQNNKSEEIFSSDTPITQAVRKYEEALRDPANQDKMQEAYEEMEKYNAWEYEAIVQEIFDKLELSSLDGKIENYSGGEKKRLALAKVLLSEADLLILDEPTNHIDLDMINWLEEYLSKKEITLLLVTHDRYFLDAVCNQILELHYGKVFKHKGNYENYIENKDTRLTNQNIEIDKTRKFLKNELEWVRKQPQGRQSKSSARVDAYHETKASMGQKVVDKKVELTSTDTRLGSKVLKLHNVSKKFGNKIILDKFSYEFKKGEKIGIIGKNGVGKSTFLNLIMGQIQADSGKVVEGQTVEFGYYSQYQTELDSNQTVIESVREIANVIKLPDGSEVSASKMLEKFLFAPKVQQTKIGKLSGGERKRVSLLKILMKNPNFLILDEPTNDFDLMTLEVLENFLVNFKGCLIIISHDRYFMDRIVDHIFVFQGDGQIKDFPGNYSDYRASVKSGNIAFTPNGEADLKTNPAIKVKTKVNNQSNDLYREIQKLEKKRDKVKENLFVEGVSFEEAGRLAKKLDELESQIEEMNDKWLTLVA